MSAALYSAFLAGPDTPSIDALEAALVASGRYIMTAGGFLQISTRERIWLEIEPMDDGLVIDVHPDTEQAKTRRAAHELVALLEEAGITGAFVFHEDPDFPDPRPESAS